MTGLADGAAPGLLQLRVHRISYEAASILSFDLRAPDGSPLPPFEAGAHVDMHLRNALVRSYSLVNAQDERDRYVVAVNRDPASRGGSVFMHDELRVGALVTVSRPRNNFALEESAESSTFFAGGVGITPILCMIRRLAALGRRWTLHYSARTRQSAAYLQALQQLAARSAGTLHLNFDQGVAANMLDIARAVADVPAGEHLYCCGPLGMMDSFEQACAGRPQHQVHVEYFAARHPPAAGGGFSVELARSGRVVVVPRGMTLLDALLDAGVRVPHSCLQGVCGTCEVKVLAGEPDHKDLVLTREEQASNGVMMVCCSGSKTGKLTLDL